MGNPGLPQKWLDLLALLPQRGGNPEQPPPTEGPFGGLDATQRDGALRADSKYQHVLGSG